MSDPRLVRAATARVYERGDELTVLGTDGAARVFAGDSADLARAVLEFYAAPRDRAELVAHLARLAGGDDVPAEPVDQLLSVLRSAGALREAPAVWNASGHAPRTRGARVVLGVSGAVAAVDAPVLVRVLQSRGHEVRAALTRNARKFVSAAALEALTHRAVHRGVWDRSAECPVPHINMAEWADVVLVCPASATTLARMAAGDCSDLVSAIVIATRAPVVIVPSMNPAMYAAPSVQRNLTRLRDDGFAVVQPAVGVELAHRPEAREPVFGPAPSASVVADVTEFVLKSAPSRARVLSPAVSPDEAWEREYQSTPAERLPWFTAAIEPDVGAAIDALGLPAGGRFLDVGTGPGTTAIEAARRGFDVVATDVSPSAIDAARRRAGELPVAWVLDDITRTRVRGEFDVVHDRGCLHVLDRARWPAYASAIARLVAPGGWLLIKSHAPDEPDDCGTQRIVAADLASLLGGAFDLVRAVPAPFAGSGLARPRRGMLAVLRRR